MSRQIWVHWIIRSKFIPLTKTHKKSGTINAAYSANSKISFPRWPRARRREIDMRTQFIGCSSSCDAVYAYGIRPENVGGIYIDARRRRGSERGGDGSAQGDHPVQLVPLNGHLDHIVGGVPAGGERYRGG